MQSKEMKTLCLFIFAITLFQTMTKQWLLTLSEDNGKYIVEEMVKRIESKPSTRHTGVQKMGNDGISVATDLPPSPGPTQSDSTMNVSSNKMGKITITMWGRRREGGKSNDRQ